MESNNINFQEIKEQINKLKLEILEKQDEIDELLKIIYNEKNIDDEFIEEH